MQKGGQGEYSQRVSIKVGVVPSLDAATKRELKASKHSDPPLTHPPPSLAHPQQPKKLTQVLNLRLHPRPRNAGTGEP